MNGTNGTCGRQPLKLFKVLWSFWFTELKKFFKSSLTQIRFCPILNTLSRILRICIPQCIQQKIALLYNFIIKHCEDSLSHTPLYGCQLVNLQNHYA